MGGFPRPGLRLRPYPLWGHSEMVRGQGMDCVGGAAGLGTGRCRQFGLPTDPFFCLLFSSLVPSSRAHESSPVISVAGQGGIWYSPGQQKRRGCPQPHGHSEGPLAERSGQRFSIPTCSAGRWYFPGRPRVPKRRVSGDHWQRLCGVARCSI